MTATIPGREPPPARPGPPQYPPVSSVLSTEGLCPSVIPAPESEGHQRRPPAYHPQNARRLKSQQEYPGCDHARTVADITQSSLVPAHERKATGDENGHANRLREICRSPRQEIEEKTLNPGFSFPATCKEIVLTE